MFLNPFVDACSFGIDFVERDLYYDLQFVLLLRGEDDQSIVTRVFLGHLRSSCNLRRLRVLG